MTEVEVVKTTCGGILEDPSKYPSAFFNSEKVYFCNTACLNVFTENPEAFMSGEIEHPLEADDKPSESKEKIT